MTTEEKIANALRAGEENAVSLSNMCRISGLDNRSTRLCIEDMRRKGAVICSSSKGYYLPSGLCDLRRYVRTEHARANSIKTTLRAAEDLLRKWESEGGNDKRF